MITLRIDVTKIDKTRLFKGDKGTYLDVILIETHGGKYGNDYMCKQAITKEEREAGKEMPILGNAKILGKSKAEPPESDFSKPPAKIEDQEDLPF